MTFTELVDRLTRTPALGRLVRREGSLVIFDVSEGLNRGRTQLVLVNLLPGGRVFGSGTLPDMVQFFSRVWRRTSGYYDHDPGDLLNPLMILANDYRPFGVTRSESEYLVALACPLDGLTQESAVEIILALASVADTFEITLSSGGEDDL